MSTVFDAKNKVAFAISLAPAVRTADANGASVDTQDSVGVAAVVHVGASGDTLSGTVFVDLELQHSDNGTDFIACLDSEIDAPVVGSNTGTFARIDAPGEANAIYKVGYLGQKRYVRVVQNLTGTHTNGIAMSAMVYLLPAHLPA
jgi:hypothetical protein